ncbi:MAG: [FeFe] hydrogenase H-cluster maturation GTPase HydF [Ruminococcaceae bacterium]|nr:[FeFe] hydrogenase H-cluster maturation GTPase HydF [Oscillospiraceae bacterium]
MSLNNVPSSERVHIGFFGLRNAGKSSLVNAVTGQKLAVVSDIKGTTTDPVQKAMELLPVGPVVIIDTPGIDDEGTLGEMRVQKAREVLYKTDLAVLVHDAAETLTEAEKELIGLFKEKKLPFILAHNKCDTVKTVPEGSGNEIYVSALTGEGIHALKELISKTARTAGSERVIVSDLISEGDTVLLVIPIDKAAPKGRLILPQQMTLRDILDKGAIPLCCRDSELNAALNKLKEPPALVITDSQVFGRVSKALPESIPLTSFSILMARYKGDLPSLLKGADALSGLKDGDRVLISEGCTHHRQCNDIGTVKMPKWIEDYSGAKPDFSFTSGGEFPEDLSPYKLVVHCGGCMLNEKEMQSRLERCEKQNVPIVNYGMAIAKMNGILERSVSVFRQAF